MPNDDYGHRGGQHGRDRGGRHDRGGHQDRDRDRGSRHDRNERRGVPLSDLDPALTELSRRVIGCAIEVHKELGPGFPRTIYDKALAIELEAEEIDFKTEHAFDVEFDEEKVGEVVCDYFIGGRFIVKVMAEHIDIGTQPRSELRAQLRAANLELGLIINFGERRLKDGLVRVLNPDKLRELRGETEPEDEYGDEDENAEEAAES